MDMKRPEDAFEDEKSARTDSPKHGLAFDKDAVDTAAALTAGSDLTVDPAAAARLRCARYQF